MIGFEKSSSFMPVARQSERAPAMLRPAVDVLERYAGIVVVAKQKVTGKTGVVANEAFGLAATHRCAPQQAPFERPPMQT
ncbi:hypothetical protein AB4851_24105 [Burkholderia sp. 22PA0099]|uniref:hypothetical protein n=1 Tax=Burkholderia sp. 22PA0099 TaxID=3237372 RepID=UPI0039C1CE08